MEPQTSRPPIAHVGLGSNLAWLARSPEEVVRAAARALGRIGPVRLSPLYDSPSWPDPANPPYVNAVLEIRTALSPPALLAACQAIEAGFGRRRDPADRNAPRTLDLDILGVGDAVLTTKTLCLPHPRLGERDFVLAPMADLAPDWRHPQDGTSLSQLLARVERTAVRRGSGPPTSWHGA